MNTVKTRKSSRLRDFAKVVYLAMTISFILPAQDRAKLLTNVPNPVSMNRPEVNVGFEARIPVFERSPEINNSGDLSDWAGAYKVEKAFMPYSPVDKGEPVTRGDLYLLWGKDGLYVAAEIFTNPKDIVGPLQGRDRDQTGHDQLNILVDPQGKGNSAVYLCVNPRNVQIDSTIVEGGGNDTSFDMIWSSGSAITSNGWVVKVKLPFSSVHRSPKDWYLALGLNITRGGVSYVLAYPQNYLDVQCNICQSIRLAGAPLKNDANVFMVVPRLFQARVESVADGTIHNPLIDNKNGIDFRYQSTTYSIEGTYKPDFATIESDVNPLYINDRFKYLYPDKRPFFMNGMDVFGDFANSSINILATRSIIEPDYGFKGSGQTGHFSWNLMQVRDLHGGDSISSDGLANVAGRQTSDTAFGTSLGFGSGTTNTKVSFAATDRELLGSSITGSNNYSRTLGLSIYQQLGQHWSLSAQGVESHANLPGTNNLDLANDGSGTSVTINGNYGSFNVFGTNIALNPNLRLDMGFIGLSGIRERLFGGGFIKRSNNAFWTSQNLNLTYDKIENWSGAPLMDSIRIGYVVGMKGPTYIAITQTLTSREWWMQQQFDKSGTYLSVIYNGINTSLVQAKMTFMYSVIKGIDYAHVAADTEKSPQFLTTVNIGPMLFNAQWQVRSIYDRYSGALNEEATRLFLFVEQVLPLDFFWRVQYQPIRYYTPLATNPGISTDILKTTSVQYLAGWRPNPFSGFYLGYNAIRGSVPTALNPRDESLVSKGLFVKITYAFTF